MYKIRNSQGNSVNLSILELYYIILFLAVSWLLCKIRFKIKTYSIYFYFYPSNYKKTTNNTRLGNKSIIKLHREKNDVLLHYLFTRLFQRRKWIQICRFAYRHNSICRSYYLRLFDSTISLDAFYIPLCILLPCIHPLISHQSADNSKTKIGKMLR